MVVVITSADTINWNAETATDKKINEIANILKTRQGEIPYMRRVGISDEYIDNPITAIKPALINNITAAINENVENVILHNIDFSGGNSAGDFIIKVVCEIE